MKSATEGVHTRADHRRGINLQRSSLSRGQAFERHGLAVELRGAIARTTGPNRPAWTGQSPVPTRKRVMIFKRGRV
jgi:hypothetical protein